MPRQEGRGCHGIEEPMQNDQAAGRRRVLVTGATGLLGSHLAERLTARGDRVRALVRPGSRTEFLEAMGVEIVPRRPDRPARLRRGHDGRRLRSITARPRSAIGARGPSSSAAAWTRPGPSPSPRAARASIASCTSARRAPTGIPSTASGRSMSPSPWDRTSGSWTTTRGARSIASGSSGTSPTPASCR